jgi:hypothetical protein
MKSRMSLCAFVLALFFGPAALMAHPAYLTAAVAKVQRDGHCTLALTFDALAFALNDSSERVPDAPMNALLDGPQDELGRRMAQARTHFERHFRVEADGRGLPFVCQRFPTVDDVLAWKATPRVLRLPVLLSCEMETQLPADAHTLAFSFPEIIGTVVLTIERPGEEASVEPVAAGAVSTPLVVTVADHDASRHADISSSSKLVSLHARLISFGRFVMLGFTHILPRGLDHVLFVLGLFLLAGRWSALLWQVTAFTIAHSVTLALALYGYVRLPGTIVEPVIAISIVLVALDNLRRRGLPAWRVAVVFGFGLVHGLGFAGALLGLGLPRSEYLPALIGFNGGVELGQLAVIALAFVTVGWWRNRPSYRRVVVVPASLCIAAVALMWTVQRIAT